MRFWTLLGRSLLLRCPRCGRSKLFRNPWSMHRECSECGLTYEREPGFFLGAIYVNYGVTSLCAVVAFPIMVFGLRISQQMALFATMSWVLVFPLWFFRYARSLWLAFDQLLDPNRR